MSRPVAGCQPCDTPVVEYRATISPGRTASGDQEQPDRDHIIASTITIAAARRASAGNVEAYEADSTSSVDARDFGFVISRTSNGGYNLLPADDHAGSMAAQVPSLPGYIDVIVHGNSTEVGTRSGPAVNVIEFSRVLDGISSLNGKPIRLMACSAGRLDDGFAQRLSTSRRTNVMAPTDTLWVMRTRDGMRTSIGPNPQTNSGKWRIFSPKDASI